MNPQKHWVSLFCSELKAGAFWVALLALFFTSQPEAAAAPPGSPAALLHTLNTEPNPKDRLQALQTLQKMGLLDTKQIARSLADTSPAIRCAVLDLAPSFFREDEELQRKLLALCYDKSPEVRLRLLKHLPFFAPARTAKPLGRILTVQSASPEAFQAAVDILGEKLPETVRVLLGNPTLAPDASGGCAALRALGTHLSTREDWLVQTLNCLQENSQSPLWQRTALLEGLALPVGAFARLREKPRSLDLLLRSPESAIAMRAQELQKRLPKINAKP